MSQCLLPNVKTDVVTILLNTQINVYNFKIYCDINQVWWLFNVQQLTRYYPPQYLNLMSVPCVHTCTSKRYCLGRMLKELTVAIKIPYSAKFWWEGNFDIFDAFQLDHQNLTHQIVSKQYSVYRCMVKDSDHPSKYFPSNIWRVSIHQNFPPSKFYAIW